MPAFAGAAKVVKLDLANNRLIPNAMEPRAAIGDFDPSTGDYTLYTTSQNPHVIRLLMGAFVLHIPENKLRVVAPDVGGGFGSQDLSLRRGGDRHLGRRQAAPAGEMDRRAQRKLHVRRARPRPRHHRRNGARQGRAFPRRCACTRWRTWAPICPPSRPACRPICTPRCWPACTRRRRSTAEVKAVFTNTVPVDAYRGAGRPEATFLLERLVDAVAHDTGHRPGRAAAAQFHPAPTRSRTRRRWRCNTTAATTTRRWTPR